MPYCSFSSLSTRLWRTLCRARVMEHLCSPDGHPSEMCSPLTPLSCSEKTGLTGEKNKLTLVSCRSAEAGKETAWRCFVEQICSELAVSV